MMANEGHAKIVNFMTPGAAEVARAWPSTSYSENALSIKNALVSSLRVSYNCIRSIAGICVHNQKQEKPV